MRHPLSTFFLTVLVICVFGTAAGIWYAQQQHIPWRVAGPILPVMLLELCLYVAPGFPAVRERMANWAGRLPWALVATCMVPYLIGIGMLGGIRIQWLLLLLLLVSAVAFWHRLVPRGQWTDLAFLALAGGVIVTKVFNQIYWNPAGKPPLGILGQLMWIRLSLSVVLLMRRDEGLDFGFLPKARECRIGLLYYVYSLPVILLLARWLDVIGEFRVPPLGRAMLIVATTVIGIYFVVALSEEFAFRGLLQRLLSQLTRSPLVGLILTSLTFGAVHLGYDGKFPNYRHAAVTAVLGLFCGMAYARSGNIRTSMVTHTLVVMTRRLFFG